MAARARPKHLCSVSPTPDPADIPPRLAAALADRYRLVRELGMGGMATVYLAEDLKHHRQVAVKVLRPELAASLGTERFLREIEIAAALHHPHILPLYDSGTVSLPTDSRLTTHDSRLLFFVMPYVEGESLRTRLQREKQLPVDDAVRIAREVADALSYAHAKGVVHRDIKPENILLESGHAMVADFGIARALTISGQERLTEVGLALGTPAYMSPEQAAGNADVDARSDIYSLGCVLYEMLAGQPPFQGATFEVLLRQHITATSLPVTQFRPATPAYISEALARALEKNPADRFAGTREFAAALGEGHTSGPRPAPTISGPVATPVAAPHTRFPRAVLYSFLALGAAAIVWRLSRDGPVRVAGDAPPPPPATRLVQLTFHEGVEEWPAWSPDGKQLAFSQEVGGFKKLFVKDLATGTERQVTSVPKDDIQPSWSPDGRRLAFVRASLPTGKLEPGDVLGWYADGGDIWSLDIAAGTERLLIEKAFNPAWSPDGNRLAFDAAWAGSRRIWIADSNGRNPQQVTGDSVESVVHASARWAPDGKRLVFRRILKTRSDIRVVDIATKSTTVITDDNVPDLDPTWSPSGRFIYFSSSRGGGLNIWRVPVDESGKSSGPGQQLTTGAGPDLELAAAPDSKRLAFAVLGINSDVWRLPVDPVTGRPTGDPAVLVGTTRVESRASWSRDGKTIAFNSDRQGDMNLWVRTLADGVEKQVTTGPGGDYQPDWSPDGSTLVFFSSRSGNNEIWTVNIASGALKQLTSGPGTKTNPFFSPDGSEVAYHSDADGRIEAWVMNSDGSGGRQVTTSGAGGHFMRWSTDGKALFLNARTPSGVRIVRLNVATGAMDSLPPVSSGAHISLSPDQQRILDVRNHKTVWVHPLDGSEPYQVFEFPDPDIRIDYPVWSPDGKWILFDRAAPSGGDIWLLEGIE